MANRPDLARRALNIVEAIAQDDPDADALIASVFDDAQAAAESYAYLSGFLLQALASEGFGGSTSSASSHVRRLIDGSS